MTPVTLITGASAGIGAELARLFGNRGHALVLVARREQRLNELAGEIAAAGHAKPLVLAMDLADPDAAVRIGAALSAREFEPQYIVNNAGFGLVGRAADLDRDEQLGMIDLNMRTLTDLSLSFVDILARHRGGILNVASIAGVMPGPGSAVYYASKAFVLSFTEALHDNLRRAASASAASAPARWPLNFRRARGSRRPSRRGRLPCRPLAWPPKGTAA